MSSIMRGDQTVMLIKLYHSNFPDIAKNTQDVEGRKRRVQMWATITEELNKRFNTAFTVEQFKKKVQNVQCTSRQKLSNGKKLLGDAEQEYVRLFESDRVGLLANQENISFSTALGGNTDLFNNNSGPIANNDSSSFLSSNIKVEQMLELFNQNSANNTIHSHNNTNNNINNGFDEEDDEEIEEDDELIINNEIKKSPNREILNETTEKPLFRIQQEDENNSTRENSLMKKERSEEDDGQSSSSTSATGGGAIKLANSGGSGISDSVNPDQYNNVNNLILSMIASQSNLDNQVSSIFAANKSPTSLAHPLPPPPTTTTTTASLTPIGSRRRKANLVPAHLTTHFQDPSSLNPSTTAQQPIKRRRKATHTLHLNHLNGAAATINGFGNNNNNLEATFSSIVAKMEATNQSLNQVSGLTNLNNPISTTPISLNDIIEGGGGSDPSNWRNEIMEVQRSIADNQQRIVRLIEIQQRNSPPNSDFSAQLSPCNSNNNSSDIGLTTSNSILNNTNNTTENPQQTITSCAAASLAKNSGSVEENGLITTTTNEGLLTAVQNAQQQIAKMANAIEDIRTMFKEVCEKLLTPNNNNINSTNNNNNSVAVKDLQIM